MLQKNKSQRVALIKYFLSAPLFILMLILSSATVNNSKTLRLINKKAEQVFLAPATVEPIEINRVSDSGNTTKKTNILTIADTVRKNDGPVFTSVEQVPEFPGGLEAFGQFLSKNIKYPAVARKNNVQGRVIISFIVEKDGSLSDVHIARGIGSGADEEAMRVINLSPKWKPGIQNGHEVRVQYSVPISFTLDNAKPGKPQKTKPAL